MNPLGGIYIFKGFFYFSLKAHFFDYLSIRDNKWGHLRNGIIKVFRNGNKFLVIFR